MANNSAIFFISSYSLEPLGSVVEQLGGLLNHIGNDVEHGFLLGSLISFPEGDSILFSAEARSVGAEEDITDNDIRECFAGRNFLGHDAHKALSFSTLSNLKNVIVLSEYIVVSIHSEGEVGKGV